MKRPGWLATVLVTASLMLLAFGILYIVLDIIAAMQMRAKHARILDEAVEMSAPAPMATADPRERDQEWRAFLARWIRRAVEIRHYPPVEDATARAFLTLAKATGYERFSGERIRRFGEVVEQARVETNAPTMLQHFIKGAECLLEDSALHPPESP